MASGPSTPPPHRQDELATGTRCFSNDPRCGAPGETWEAVPMNSRLAARVPAGPGSHTPVSTAAVRRPPPRFAVPGPRWRVRRNPPRLLERSALPLPAWRLPDPATGMPPGCAPHDTPGLAVAESNPRENDLHTGSGSALFETGPPHLRGERSTSTVDIPTGSSQQRNLQQPVERLEMNDGPPSRPAPKSCPWATTASMSSAAAGRATTGPASPTRPDQRHQQLQPGWRGAQNRFPCRVAQAQGAI
jgi:hypothetical protein